jgi:hypothetical protein
MSHANYLPATPESLPRPGHRPLRYSRLPRAVALIALCSSAAGLTGCGDFNQNPGDRPADVAALPADQRYELDYLGVTYDTGVLTAMLGQDCLYNTAYDAGRYQLPDKQAGFDVIEADASDPIGDIIRITPNPKRPNPDPNDTPLELVGVTDPNQPLQPRTENDAQILERYECATESYTTD